MIFSPTACQFHTYTAERFVKLHLYKAHNLYTVTELILIISSSISRLSACGVSVQLIAQEPKLADQSLPSFCATDSKDIDSITLIINHSMDSTGECASQPPYLTRNSGLASSRCLVSPRVSLWVHRDSGTMMYTTY